MSKKNTILVVFVLTGAFLVGLGVFKKVELYQQTQQQLMQKKALFAKARTKFNSVKHAKYDNKVIHDFDYKDYKAAIDNDIINKYSIGTITIPSVGIKEPILEGVSNQKLSVGVVTVKPNQKPGQGNYALAGHNQLNNGKLLFGNLAYVKPGNQIIISTKEGTFKYQVTQIDKRLSAAHGEIIDDNQGEGIVTLYTCNNQTNNDRIFVRGRLLE